MSRRLLLSVVVLAFASTVLTAAAEEPKTKAAPNITAITIAADSEQKLVSVPEVAKKIPEVTILTSSIEAALSAKVRGYRLVKETTDDELSPFANAKITTTTLYVVIVPGPAGLPLKIKKESDCPVNSQFVIPQEQILVSKEALKSILVAWTKLAHAANGGLRDGVTVKQYHSKRPGHQEVVLKIPLAKVPINQIGLAR